MKEFTPESFVQDLDKLISFRTVVDPAQDIRNTDQFDAALFFIKNQVDPRASMQVLENQGEKVLLMGNQPTKTPDILYLAHVDVVSANDDQFKMRVEGDTVYGRGVSDMKYSIPLGYGLLNQLIADESQLSYVLAVTTDEERGGFNAARFLAEEYQMRPQVVIIPDGGDDFVLINKFKGVRHIQLTAEGNPAHSSRPWNGNSAVEPLVETLSILLRKYRQNNRTEGWHTTVNPGKIVGGDSINRLAKSAEVALDFRFPESVSPEDLDREVSQAVKDAEKELGIPIVASTKVLAVGAHGFVDTNDPTFQLFKSILEAHVGRPLKIEGGYGSNDGRHFTQFGIPFLMTKPPGADEHGNNENLNISSTILFYHALVDFLQRYEQSR